MKLGRLSWILAVVAVLAIVGQVQAAILSGEYTIAVTATPTPSISNSYQFEYAITNNGQQSLDPLYSPYTGLDGFFIQVPLSATISNVVSPAGYWTTGEGWEPPFGTAQLSPGKEWLGWWGQDWESAYQDNETAVFKFQADGVALGTTTGVVDTFWAFDSAGTYYYAPHGTYYSEYSTSLEGPVAVPEPASIAIWSLLGTVGAVVAYRRRRKAAQN